MRTVRTLSALFVVAFMVSAGAASPTAAQQQGTRCVAEFSMVLSPGLSEKASAGAFHSGGETGTITCADGRKGTYGTDGRYGTKNPSTCSSGGEGWGVSSFTIKNANVKNTYTITFAGVSQGTVQGTIQGETFSGSFTFTPTEGDCFTKPMSKGTVRAEGILQD
jgi:hypothetical protein